MLLKKNFTIMNPWGTKCSFDQTGKGLCDSFKNTRSLLAETILYISHMIRRNFKDGGRAVLSHIQTQLCSLVLNVICNYNISR